MTKSKLRVLLVEDCADDAELVTLELEKAGFEVAARRVDTEETFLAALEEADWDLVISDFQMPTFNGLRAFRLFREQDLDIPFLFVSGVLGEERAVEAMRAGARDYLLKGNLTRMGAAVQRELDEVRNRRIRRGAEEEALRERRRLAMAVEASGAGVFEYELTPEEKVYVSERWCSILGRDRIAVPRDRRWYPWFLEQIHEDDRAGVRRAIEAFAAGEIPKLGVEARMRHRDGRWLAVALFANAVERDAGGRASRIVGVMLDLSERRLLEEQLRQAQKMEAVGRLAGGVAHDFNNLLTVIFSFGSFVLEALEPGSPAHEDMKDVLEAARKAESLTAQLLAFSRRRTVAPRVINLTETVRGVEKMLRRLLGEDIGLESQLVPDLWNVKIDPEIFEQVLMNMAVNSRDAMPDGGKLIIETANVTLGIAYARTHGVEVPAGDYVMVALSDTGAGMDASTQEKVFEPFFTTKGKGKGTGLGLSTCYGIVKQAGGYIWVYSESGKGTTFKIYLPRVSGETDVREARRAPSTLEGAERILLVEDDEQVRRLTVRALRRYGYEVCVAASGDAALAEFRRAKVPFDLLLSDLVIPGPSGPALAERLQAEQPGLKVLFMSGYTAHAAVGHGLEPGAELIQKPFSPDDLAHRIRSILDRKKLEPAS